MIVELYGCPGCGKTYAIKAVTGEEKTIAMSNNWAKKKIINWAKKMSLYTFSSIKLKHNLIKCVKNERNSAIYINRAVEAYIDSIVALAFIYRHVKNMWMAEGLIHRVVSMGVNFGYTDETVYKLLSCLKDVMINVKPVYIDVPISICFEGIKKRNRHECEMDELNDKMLMSYLESYRHLFEYITKKNGYMKITRNNISVLEDLLK